VWSAPREEDPVVAVLVEHGGLCPDCLAEKAKLSLDRGMVAVRRTQSDVLLAFVTPARALCSRKSLVTHVPARVAAPAPLRPPPPVSAPPPRGALPPPATRARPRGVAGLRSRVGGAGPAPNKNPPPPPPVPSGATA